MSTAQKIIKMLAIAFAIFLIVTIITTLLRVGMFITRQFIPEKGNPVVEKRVNLDNIESLDINLEYASLKVKKGNRLSVSTDSDEIKVTNYKDVLKITEKNNRKLFKDEKRTVILYVPEDMKFKTVNIETGVGAVNIENISTDGLNLSSGVGKTVINNILANLANIETGAGDMLIRNGNLNNSTIEIGVGKLDVNAVFTGSNKIEAGIGALKLSLHNSDDYKISFSKGLGSISYNGDTINGDTTVGNGNNYISIEGGIGSIDVITTR